MPSPKSHDLDAIKKSSGLLQFAAENKTGLHPSVVTDLKEGWDSADVGSWTTEVATKFWVAYDALNSHLKPVSLDTLEACSLNLKHRLSFLGVSRPTSQARRTANFYRNILVAALALTMVVAFVASAADTTVKQLIELNAEGDKKVRLVRERLNGISTEVANAPSLDDPALSPDSKKWVSELRAELQDMYFIADQMFHKVNSSAFRALGVPALSLCKDIHDKENCYSKGSLKNPEFKEAAIGNVEDFYRTRREISMRRDHADTRLSILKSYLLPALLGLLGSCTYVVRLISEQIRDMTFTSTSPIRHMLRVLIGSLAGVVIVMGNFLVTAGLSTLALSFIAGYATETFFSAIDSIAGKFRS